MTWPRDPWKERAAAALLLLLIVGIFFAPMLATGRFFAPGDGIAQNYPMRLLAAEAWRAGEIPFWNPYNFSGAPLMAAIQPGVFYPGNLPFLFLPGPIAMNVTMLLAYWLAAVGTFLFCRAQGLSAFPSFVSAIAFMGGGNMVLNVQNMTIVQVASLMPFLLWAIARLADTGSTRHGVAGAVVLALLILAGHPQTVAYSGLLAGCYAAYRLAGLRADARGPFVLGLFVMGAVGTGLAAVQLLPTLDFIRDTQRQIVSFDQLVFNSPFWMGLPSLVFPEWLGTRSKGALFGMPLWAPGPWRWWMFAYMGLGALLLAGIGLGRATKDGGARLWGAIALVAFILALGDATPLYRVWAMLPVVNQMPYPHRHLLEFNWAVAMLAGLGAAALSAGVRRPLAVSAGAIGAAMAAFLAFLAIFGGAFAVRTQPYMPAGVDVVAALRLFQPAFWVPPLILAASAAAVWAVARRPSAPRRTTLLVLLLADLCLAGYHNGDWQFGPELPSAAPAPAERRSLGLPAHYYPYYLPVSYQETLELPGLAGTRGIRSVGGYDAFIDRRYAKLLDINSAGQMTSTRPFEPSNHVLDILALDTVQIDAKRAEQAQWRTIFEGPRWQRLSGDNGVERYRNSRALLRAWRVQELAVMAPDAIDQRLITDPSFEPREEALIESPIAHARLTPGTASIEALSLNRIRLTTEGEGPGFVVVSESYSIGWRAFLGGREVPIVRTDALIMGLEVPPGRLEVELRYEPPRFRAGLALSGLAALALFGWCLGGRRHRRRLR